MDQVRGHALAGFAPPGWDMLRAIRHSCFSGPFSRRIPSAVPTQSPTRTSSPQGHQLPPPEMRPWGSRPVTSEGLSHACSPRNPATSCTGSPKRHPAPCDPHTLPTTMGRREAIRHHEEVLSGPLAPISQAGKTEAPGVVAACPDPQQDPAACYLS